MDGEEDGLIARIMANPTALLAIGVAFIVLVLALSGGNNGTKAGSAKNLTTSTTLTFQEEMARPTTSTTSAAVQRVTTTLPPTSTTIVRKYEVSMESCRRLQGMESLDCFTELAFQSKDVKICDKIADGQLRDGCVRHYALRVGNSDVCSLFKDDNQKFLACYTELATTPNQTGQIHCNNLSDMSPPYMQSMCRLDTILITYRSIPGQCLAIGQKDLRTYCTAVVSGKSSLCMFDKDAWEGEWLMEKCTKCIPENNKLKCRLYIDNKGGLYKML
jgi:hypothetical protein